MTWGATSNPRAQRTKMAAFFPGADAYQVKWPLCRRLTGSFGHTAEVQGLHRQTAALRLEPAAQIINFDLPD